MTESEMGELRSHPAWYDGRVGYLWCRFDGIVCEKDYLRAEITWGDTSDDSDFVDGETPIIYSKPELLIESNYPDEINGWVRVDCDVIGLTDAEVLAILAAPPHELLAKYRKGFGLLRKLQSQDQERTKSK